MSRKAATPIYPDQNSMQTVRLDNSSKTPTLEGIKFPNVKKDFYNTQTKISVSD